MPTIKFDVDTSLTVAHVEVERLKAENRRLTAERDTLRETLALYADKANWFSISDDYGNGPWDAFSSPESGEPWEPALAALRQKGEGGK